MTLQVEDGTGGDTMLSVVDFEAYCEAIGYDISSFDEDTDIEPALRRASRYVSNEFSFQGLRIGNRAQLQAWPRSGAITPEGWGVSSTSIPVEVQDAVAEVTFYDLGNPGTLYPTVVLADRVKSEQVGPLRVEYAGVFSDTSESKPILTIINSILKPLLANSAGWNGLTARADRG